jgi:hypothetical protein
MATGVKFFTELDNIDNPHILGVGWYCNVTYRTSNDEITNSLISKRTRVRLRKNAIASETLCVYSAVYVYLRRWKMSFYLLTMC